MQVESAAFLGPLSTVGEIQLKKKKKNPPTQKTSAQREQKKKKDLLWDKR